MFSHHRLHNKGKPKIHWCGIKKQRTMRHVLASNIRHYFKKMAAWCWLCVFHSVLLPKSFVKTAGDMRRVTSHAVKISLFYIFTKRSFLLTKYFFLYKRNITHFATFRVRTFILLIEQKPQRRFGFEMKLVRKINYSRFTKAISHPI